LTTSLSSLSALPISHDKKCGYHSNNHATQLCAASNTMTDIWVTFWATRRYFYTAITTVHVNLMISTLLYCIVIYSCVEWGEQCVMATASDSQTTGVYNMQYEFFIRSAPLLRHWVTFTVTSAVAMFLTLISRKLCHILTRMQNRKSLRCNRYRATQAWHVQKQFRLSNLSNSCDLSQTAEHNEIVFGQISTFVLL